MRENVQIHHPITGGEATVAARAVPIWQGAGWVVASEAQSSDAPTDDTPPADLPAAQAAGAGARRAKTPAVSPITTDTAAAGSSSTEK